ncbi:MAG: DUF4403 family protein [Gemmatimonadales bacterium]|nr:DUF4403 family protein [Gemmatimonadales bacterium]
MTPSIRRGAAGVLACIALAHLAFACRGDKVAPPAPRATAAWVDTLPPVPTSYLDVPVRYDLAPAMRWLESEIPMRIGDLEDRQAVPDNQRMHYAYEATRTPFRLAVHGRTATLQADLNYRVRGWYNPPVLPEISGACDDDDAPPRARLTVETTVQLTRTWTLRPRSRAVVAPLSHPDRDRCKVTFLSIDVTDKVVGAAQAALQRELTDLDAKLAAFDLPRESRRLWHTLGSPLELTDSLWLVINPSTVRIGLLRMRGDTLVTTIGVSANPRVIGGPRPQVKPRPMPAPEDSTSLPPVLHLLTEGRLPYDVASSILTRELRGTVVKVARQRLVLDSLHLVGMGDGRVAVGLRVQGAVHGVLWAVGRPAYDTATAELYMPDLQYDGGTRDLLTGTLAWLAEGQIEEFLRTRVRIKLAGVLADGRDLLEQELNRDLADGVHLGMKVNTGRVLSVRASPTALLIRAVASGKGELVLDLRPEQLVGGENESLGAAGPPAARTTPNPSP